MRANLDQLKEQFYIAANIDNADEEFQALLTGYKEAFGDKYDLLIHVLYNHMSADLYDYLHEEMKK